MRALVQRVSQAQVKVGGETVGRIGRGLLVFLAVGRKDTAAQADVLVRKVTQLRIFSDDSGKMNYSAIDVAAELLIVSQFTLYGNTSKGNRPSYTEAATLESARELYDYFVGRSRETGLVVATGLFQADMDVSLVNEGPVTLMCYSDA